MLQFLHGGIFVAALIIALFFLRFWRETMDRFFGFFAVAFFLLACERLPLVLLPNPKESQPYIYLFRLTAFLVILFAIYDKNKGSRPNRTDSL